MRRAAIALSIVFVGSAVGGAAIAAAPVAYDDEFTAIEFEENVFDVLTNDVDPDGDPLTIQSYTQSLEGGSVHCEPEGECTYVDPGGSPPYEDSFTYTVTDGTSTDTATVAITVQAAGEVGADKRITLKLTGQLVARGTVTSSDARCMRDERIKIFRKDEGYWNLVKKSISDDQGHYRIRIPHRFGRYRAETSGSEACNRDRSPTRSYLSNDPQSISDGDDVPGFLDIAKVRIDHDGFDLHFKWTAHDQWQLSSLTGGKRLGVYLFLNQGYYSIDIDMGEDLPIVPIVRCGGAPGSGNSCDYGDIEYGEGQKAGPKAIKFTLPLRHLDALATSFPWQGHSASSAGGGFDFTNKKTYHR